MAIFTRSNLVALECQVDALGITNAVFLGDKISTFMSVGTRLFEAVF